MSDPTDNVISLDRAHATRDPQAPTVREIQESTVVEFDRGHPALRRRLIASYRTAVIDRSAGPGRARMAIERGNWISISPDYWVHFRASYLYLRRRGIDRASARYVLWMQAWAASQDAPGSGPIFERHPSLPGNGGRR